MSLVFKCGKCKGRYDFGLKACPTCHEPNVLFGGAVPRPRQPALSTKARVRLAARRGSSHVRGQGAAPRDPKKPVAAAKFPRRYRGKLLRAADGLRLGDSERWWHVHVTGWIPTPYLMGRVLEWERLGQEGKYVLIRPVETDWTRQLQRKLEAEQRAFKVQGFGPRLAGSTSIERLDSMLAQTAEIQRLASEVDKPGAWAGIASCWHIRGLRRPIQQAFAAIGWERINWLVHANDGWPTDLVELVEQEVAKKPSTGGKLPWYPDDYLLQDW